jgi:hypothetical protein
MGLFLGGVRLKQALTVVVLAGLMMPLAFHVLKPYQRDRLTSFMQPEADSQGSGYQVIQSLIAVGSGGLWGSTAASQTHQAFLPVPQTDFIFAAFAEEHGFVGALTVMLLYFIVLMRLTQNAQTAPDRAGAFVVMGVVAVLSFHILVNVGMVVGFMPVWNTLALNELWRVFRPVYVSGAGHCDECSDAPLRELKQGKKARSGAALAICGSKQDYDRPRVKRALTGQNSSERPGRIEAKALPGG